MNKGVRYLKVTAVSKLLFVLIVLMNFCNSCSETGGRINTPADFTGFITQIKISPENGVGTIYAESHADKLVHRYVIKVTRHTGIYQLENNQYISIDINKLLLKDQIQVWFSGYVRKSKPVRTKASQVVVINHY